MNPRRSSSVDNLKFCTSCGHSNPPWAKKCERCRAELEALPKLTVSGSRERPGCVTVYAALMAIGAVLTIVAGIIFSLSGAMMNQYIDEILSSSGLDRGLPGQGFDSALLTQILNIVIPVTLAITFLAGVFNLLVAWGLWRLKNWARILVIIVQSLGLLSYIYSLVVSVIAPSSASSDFTMASSYGTICVSLVSLAIGGYFVFWFVTNGDYFS